MDTIIWQLNILIFMVGLLIGITLVRGRRR